MEFFLVAKRIMKKKAGKKSTEVQSSLKSAQWRGPRISTNIFLKPEAQKKVITQKDWKLSADFHSSSDQDQIGVMYCNVLFLLPSH